MAPSGLGVFPDHSELEKSSDRNANRERANPKGLLKLSQFGRRFLLMKTRSRVTKDRGVGISCRVTGRTSPARSDINRVFGNLPFSSNPYSVV